LKDIFRMAREMEVLKWGQLGDSSTCCLGALSADAGLVQFMIEEYLFWFLECAWIWSWIWLLPNMLNWLIVLALLVHHLHEAILKSLWSLLRAILTMTFIYTFWLRFEIHLTHLTLISQMLKSIQLLKILLNSSTSSFLRPLMMMGHRIGHTPKIISILIWRLSSFLGHILLLLCWRARQI